MKIVEVKHSSAEGIERTPLPENLVAWLNSDSGRNAIAAALSNSDKVARDLKEAQKIQPDQLHVPITL